MPRSIGRDSPSDEACRARLSEAPVGVAQPREVVDRALLHVFAGGRRHPEDKVPQLCVIELLFPAVDQAHVARRPGPAFEKRHHPSIAEFILDVQKRKIHRNAVVLEKKALQRELDERDEGSSPDKRLRGFPAEKLPGDGFVVVGLEKKAFMLREV